jgi:hypothetical protein
MSRKRAKQKANKKTKDIRHSTIEQHHRQGKRLIPPLANLPKTQPRSWRTDRLPEMLWATLLVSHLPRPEALKVFRELADHMYKYRDIGLSHDITHTGLSNLKPEQLLKTLSIIARTDARKHALSSLLLLNDLPARDPWHQVLEHADTTESWKALMIAVARTLDHQSQESTDCRWGYILCVMAAGKLQLPTELAKEFLYYPDYGDMRKVRPSIRATELAFTSLGETEEREWPNKFWAQCYKDTGCFPLPTVSHLSTVIGTMPERVRQVYGFVVEHCNKTITTTAIDPEHDTVFGFALYCLSILQELLRIGASQSITARMALRTLVDSFITLAYLTKKNDPELWKSFRVFGAGQAKLQYLKLETLDETPSFVDVSMLKDLANEDLWEEFLPIELGHWNRADLRNLSIDAGVKDDYDKFYTWTSSYAHSHWGSVRDSVYDNCGNPLHRLHRIPRESARALPDIVPDACEVIDKILEIVEECYPGFPHRVTVQK